MEKSFMIDELKPQDTPVEAPPADIGERVIHIPEEMIAGNAYQPRHRFEEKAMDELKRSIREKGIIQPIIVRRKGEGYEIVAGERRLIAARQAGLKKIPALVKEITEPKDILEIALIENIQREDLNPIDMARSYRRLMDEFGETQEMVAERMGKDRSSIANTLRLLELPEEIKLMIEEGRINFGQARALLSVKERERMLKFARLAADGRISVRKLEKMISRKPRKKVAHQEDAVKESHVQYVEDSLREALMAKVTIVQNREGGGMIEIEYFSQDELTRLCDLIGERKRLNQPYNHELNGDT